MLFACLTLFVGCRKTDAGSNEGMLDSSELVRSDQPNRPVNVPKQIIPDTFSRTGRTNDWDARRPFDFTGDGRPEIVTVHARGSRKDSADVILSIMAPNGELLYGDTWNTSHYFRYTPRATLSEDEATRQVLAKLKRLLSDSSFTSDGPSALLRNSPDAKASGGISHDAVLYDLKEAVVRVLHAAPTGVPLTPPQLAEIDTINISNAAVATLANELKKMPTFTYHAGGEVTYTIAWSAEKKRFVRIFSCC